MDAAKIRLSPKEMELVSNPDWILTKNAILKKTMQMLGHIQEQYAAYLRHRSHQLPAEIFEASAKISKGENYRGLPYQVLDYPRRFDQQDIFAIRTMFWWGHFFSITLHLGGKYKKEFADRIGNAYSRLSAHDFYCCINEDPWQHHFEADNYKAMNECSAAELRRSVEERTFIKLAAKTDITQWDHCISLLQKRFELLIEILEA